MKRTIRTITSVRCARSGVGNSCFSVVQAAATAGFDTDLSAIQISVPRGRVRVHSVIPRPFGEVPISTLKRWPHRALERAYLRRIREEDVAYIWPLISLKTHEALHRRGIPIVVEAVNTRMAVAKPLLDAAYDAFGAKPNHGISDARIVDQEARLAMASTIFAPSPATEAALAGTRLGECFIPASYGIHYPETLPVRPPADESRVVFLFVGYACVRKGAHLLLEAWKQAPKNTHLRIIGDIEPVIGHRFADVLASDRVSAPGFVSDTRAEYMAADVMIFPTLEEGDPIVTLEAAAHGLPVLTTIVGSGRIGADTSCCVQFDAWNRDEMVSRIAEFAGSESLRRHWGNRARIAAADYDWSLVGARRYTRLCDFFRMSSREETARVPPGRAAIV